MRWHGALVLSALVLWCGGLAGGQSLADRVDEDELLRGWVELHLPEVLRAYVRQNPTSDGAQQLAREIAALRMELSAPYATDVRRDEVMSELGERVERAANEYPDDPRRGVWQIQHATDLLLMQLPIEGSGVAALYGVPSSTELERARVVAWQAYELSEEAAQGIREAIVRLEAESGGDRVERLRRRQLIGRMAHDERDHRVPFVRGMAAVLHAEFSVRDNAERTGLYTIAQDQLYLVEGDLQGRARVLARLYLGLALARLGNFDEAETKFRQVATDESALEIDVFAARMGGTLNREQNHGVDHALAGLQSIERNYRDEERLFYRMIIADRRFLLLRRQAMAGPAARRTTGLAEAFDAYLGLLDEQDAYDGEQLRAVVDARLSRVTEVDLPVEEMPTPLLLATARRMGAIDATRDEATRLLASVIGREGVSARHMAEAMYELARLRLADGDEAGASELFLRLARDLPDDLRAVEAVEIGVALALHVSRASPEDAAARGRARQGLELLLGKYGRIRGVDRWQYESAVFALEDGRLDDVDAFVEQISERADTWLDARLLWVQVARRRLLATDDARARHEAARALASRIAEAAPYVRGSGGTMEGGPLALLTVFEAEAALAQGNADRAIELIDRISEPSALDESVFIIAMRVKVEAYRKAERAGEVVDDLRALAERSEEWATTITRGLLDALRAEALGLVRGGYELEGAAFAEREMLGLAELLDHLTRGAVRSMDDTMLVGDSYRLSRRFDEAMETYRMLPAERGDQLSVLLGRAECLYGLGDDRLGEAMLIYRRVGAMGVEAVGEAYWLSQLRMLQILDRKDQNTQKIVPRIMRLRYDDPSLGTDQVRKGLERLERKYLDDPGADEEGDA